MPGPRLQPRILAEGGSRQQGDGQQDGFGFNDSHLSDDRGPFLSEDRARPTEEAAHPDDRPQFTTSDFLILNDQAY